MDLRTRPQSDLLVDGSSARRASWGLKILRAGPSGEAAAGFYRDLPAGTSLPSRYDIGLVGRVRGSAVSPGELVGHEGFCCFAVGC